MVIVNLQRTPLEGKADIKISAKTDTVTEMLMERLGRAIPPFRLQRRLIVGVQKAATGATSSHQRTAFVQSVDPHDPSLPLSLVRHAKWRDTEKTDLARIPVTVTFKGDYNEPPLDIELNLQASPQLDVRVAYDPFARTYEVEQTLLARLPTQSASAKERQAHGRSGPHTGERGSAARRETGLMVRECGCGRTYAA